MNRSTRPLAACHLRQPRIEAVADQAPGQSPDQSPGPSSGPSRGKPPLRQQRGISLFETLIAAGLLALGLHGALRLGLQGLQMGQETAEQLHARHLALQLLECHALPWPDCSTEREVTWQGTRYRVWLQPQTGEVPGTERLLATVQWQGVLPAMGGAAPAATASPAPPEAPQQVQLWRERAAVPHWLGVSSP